MKEAAWRIHIRMHQAAYFYAKSLGQGAARQNVPPREFLQNSLCHLQGWEN